MEINKLWKSRTEDPIFSHYSFFRCLIFVIYYSTLFKDNRKKSGCSVRLVFFIQTKMSRRRRFATRTSWGSPSTESPSPSTESLSPSTESSSPSSSSSVEDTTSISSEIEADLMRLRLQNVEETSRDGYIRSVSHFIIWLNRTKPSLLSDEYRGLQWTEVKAKLKRPEGQPPIKLEQLTHLDFLAWVTTLKKADGSAPGFSSLNGHKSALMNLFRDFKVIPSGEFIRELSVHFAAIRKTRQKKQQTVRHQLKAVKNRYRLHYIKSCWWWCSSNQTRNMCLHQR